MLALVMQRDSKELSGSVAIFVVVNLSLLIMYMSSIPQIYAEATTWHTNLHLTTDFPKRQTEDKSMSQEQHTFVLVHGSWYGGWVWRNVKTRLCRLGHRATSPTLTGVGERAHIGNDSASLNTHTEDIVAHIEMEDLRDVTLVGWSYGGMVTTGVSARIPNKIKSLIYLDAFVPEDGKAMIDYLPREVQDEWNIYREEDKPIPPLPVEFFRLKDPAIIKYVTSRVVPHPWRSVFEPLKPSSQVFGPPMSYIRCAGNDAAVYFDKTVGRLRSSIPGFRVKFLDTIHLAMLTMPEQTTEALVDLA